MTYEALYTAIENALCDGGNEQHDVHVTHADKAARYANGTRVLTIKGRRGL